MTLRQPQEEKEALDSYHSQWQLCSAADSTRVGWPLPLPHGDAVVLVSDSAVGTTDRPTVELEFSQSRFLKPTERHILLVKLLGLLSQGTLQGLEISYI